MLNFVFVCFATNIFALFKMSVY